MRRSTLYGSELESEESMETVTISAESTTLVDPSTKHEVLAKELSCTCQWKQKCQVLRAEAMAKHHLLYTHGGGRYLYDGSEETI